MMMMLMIVVKRNLIVRWFDLFLIFFCRLKKTFFWIDRVVLFFVLILTVKLRKNRAISFALVDKTGVWNFSDRVVRGKFQIILKVDKIVSKFPLNGFLIFSFFNLQSVLSWNLNCQKCAFFCVLCTSILLNINTHRNQKKKEFVCKYKTYLQNEKGKRKKLSTEFDKKCKKE